MAIVYCPELPLLPGHKLHRTLSGVDGADSTDLSAGLDPGGLQSVAIEVAPLGAMTRLDVEVMVWGAVANKFVSMNPAVTFANVTKASVLIAEVYGQKFWVKATTFTAAANIKLFVSGLEYR